MTNFLNYLKNTGQTLRTFSKRVNVSENYLSEIARCKRKPSLDVAYDIWQSSGGVITMQMLKEDYDAGQSVSHIARQKSTETTEVQNEGASNGR